MLNRPGGFRTCYNDFAQLTQSWQAHTGTVNTGSTPQVQYSYASGSANTIRITGTTYPNGRNVVDDYGTTGRIDDACSRIRGMKNFGAAANLVEYHMICRCHAPRGRRQGRMGGIETWRSSTILHQQIDDRVPSLGTSAVGTARRLTTVYDSRGMVLTVTTWDDPRVGFGSVQNQVQNAYNDFGQQTASCQSHSGTANISTSPKVQYNYADGSRLNRFAAMIVNLEERCQGPVDSALSNELIQCNCTNHEPILANRHMFHVQAIRRAADGGIPGKKPGFCW